MARFPLCMAGLLLLFIINTAGTHGASAQSVDIDFPSTIDPGKRYMFFMHGLFFETYGGFKTNENFGRDYRFNDNVEALASRGFRVISEARLMGTKALTYAKKVAEQAQKLLDAGVHPENITIVGNSKGGDIAFPVSAILGNNDVRYVILETCYPGEKLNAREAEMAKHFQGQILSVYDHKSYLGSCRNQVAPALENNPGLIFEEIMIRDGAGHGTYYWPNDSWLDPVEQWAKRPHVHPSPEDAARSRPTISMKKFILYAMDRDEDGFVSREEFEESSQRRDERKSQKQKKSSKNGPRFEQFDTDGDGTISMVEIAATDGNSRKRRQPGGGSKNITWMDRDGDGRISEKEFKGPPRIFQRIDKDGDGILSQVEIATMGGGAAGNQTDSGAQTGPGGPGQKRIRDMDKDGDGRVSRDEFRGPAKKFKKIDSNGDGFLTLDEFNKVLSRRGGGAGQ